MTPEITPTCERDERPSPEKWLAEFDRRLQPRMYAAMKDLRRHAKRGYRKIVLARRINKDWRQVARELSGQQESREQYVQRRFDYLAARWQAETRHVSSLTHLASHPSYQEIVRLGWDAVPILLRDLQQNKRFWFPALYEITKVRPFDPNDAGNGKRMTDAWITWGKRKGLI